MIHTPVMLDYDLLLLGNISFARIKNDRYINLYYTTNMKILI